MLAFALAPMLELQVTAVLAAAAVSAAGGESQRTAPVHDPATCPACSLVHAQVWQPRADVVAFDGLETRTAVLARTDAADRSALYRGIRSRAPPHAFV